MVIVESRFTAQKQKKKTHNPTCTHLKLTLLLLHIHPKTHTYFHKNPPVTIFPFLKKSKVKTYPSFLFYFFNLIHFLLSFSTFVLFGNFRLKPSQLERERTRRCTDKKQKDDLIPVHECCLLRLQCLAVNDDADEETAAVWGWPMAGDQKSAPLLLATCTVQATGTRHSPRLLRSFLDPSSPPLSPPSCCFIHPSISPVSDSKAKYFSQTNKTKRQKTGPFSSQMR